MEDHPFIEIKSEAAQIDESGNLEYPLPFKSTHAELSNRYPPALKQPSSLVKTKDTDLKWNRVCCILWQDVGENHALLPVPEKELTCPGKVWYLPHFIVHHQRNLTPMSCLIGALNTSMTSSVRHYYRAMTR